MPASLPRRLPTAGLFLLLALIACGLPTACADTAPVVIHIFKGTEGTGENSGLTLGTDGFLYGTYSRGGANSGGIAFRLKQDGSGFTIFYAFGGTDAAPSSPEVGLTEGGDGYFYGTGFKGGASGLGAVFRLKPDGSAFQTLHSFSALDVNNHNSDGAKPSAVLVRGTDGALYGTTESGGAQACGTVYKVSTDGAVFQTLYSFQSVYLSAGQFSSYPTRLITSDGVLYGATSNNGANGAGMVFKINTDGTGFQALHSFGAFPSSAQINADGAHPTDALLMGRDGALYGTASTGGANGEGTLFKLQVDGNGFAVLHTFTRTIYNGTNPDGINPQGALVQEDDGTLYGMAEFGGTNGTGTLYSIQPDGNNFVARPFPVYTSYGPGNQPYYPTTALTVGAGGLLYGVAGPIFKFTPLSPMPSSVSVTPAQVIGGSAATGTVTLSAPAPDGGVTVRLSSSNADVASLPSSLTVSAGQTSAAFAITTRPVTSTTLITISAASGSGVASASLTVQVSSHTHPLWNNSDGRVMFWNVASDGSFTLNGFGPYTDNAPQNKWSATAVATGADGLSHLLWNNTDGRVMLWTVDDSGSFTLAGYGPYTDNAPQNKWSAVGVSVGPDNTVHLLWSNTDHRAMLWNVASDFSFTLAGYGPYTDNAPQNLWTATALSTGPDGVSHILWNNSDYRVMLWDVNADFSFTLAGYGPYTDGAPQNLWSAVGVSVGPDNMQHILWSNTDRRAMFWNVDGSFNFTLAGYGPYTDNAPQNLWTASAVATGPDGLSHILWGNTDYRAMLWGVDNAFNFGVSGYGPYTDNAPGNLWSVTAVSAGP